MDIIKQIRINDNDFGNNNNLIKIKEFDEDNYLFGGIISKSV